MTRRIASLAGLLVLCLVACSPGQAASPSAASSSATASLPATATPAPTASPQVAAACERKKVPFDANKIELSGPWAGDDGGIYYLRQLDNVVWWNGMPHREGTPSDLGRGWNNVARGEIGRDMTISVEWADVPRGEVLGGGTLELKIGPDDQGNIQIVKNSETGSGLATPSGPPAHPAEQSWMAGATPSATRGASLLRADSTLSLLRDPVPSPPASTRSRARDRILRDPTRVIPRRDIPYVGRSDDRFEDLVPMLDESQMTTVRPDDDESCSGWCSPGNRCVPA